MKREVEISPTPRKSGINIPESQRSTTQLKLRVEPVTITQLDALCGDTWTRSDFVSALIDSETGRKKRRKKRPVPDGGSG